MGKKCKKIVVKEFPIRQSDGQTRMAPDVELVEMLARARYLQYQVFDFGYKLQIRVAGPKKKIKAFKHDLSYYGFVVKMSDLNRSKEYVLIDDVGTAASRMLDKLNDKLKKCHIPKEEKNVKAVLDYTGIREETRYSEEDDLPVDQGGETPGEDGRVPASDPGRPAGAEEGPGYSQMAVPVPEEIGEWLTVSEYSAKYGIHESTLYSWIRPSNKKRPTHPVPISKKENSATYIWDGHMVPVKEKLGKRFVYRWVNRENLENANSQVNGSL